MPTNQTTLPAPCQFILYQDDKSHVTINVRFEGDDVWQAIRH